MRYGFALLTSVGVLACNAIVGFGDMEKVYGETAPLPEDPDAGPATRRPDGGGKAEGGSKGPPSCDPSAPFGAPVVLPGPINSAAGHEGSPTLTADELTIVFGRIIGTADGSVLMATRDSFDQPFGEPTAVPGIDDTKNNYAPSMTEDGLFLYWSVQEVSGLDITSAKIFGASRSNRSARFEKTAEFLPSSHLRISPFVSRDGTEVYFTRIVSGTSGPIWRSTRGEFAVYGAAARVAELDETGSVNGGIALMPDGLRMYFASSRAPAVGPNDVFTATRADKSAPWENISQVPELSSPSSDRPAWISPDGCRLYLASERAGEGAIYMASRP